MNARVIVVLVVVLVVAIALLAQRRQLPRAEPFLDKLENDAISAADLQRLDAEIARMVVRPYLDAAARYGAVQGTNAKPGCSGLIEQARAQINTKAATVQVTRERHGPFNVAVQNMKNAVEKFIFQNHCAGKGIDGYILNVQSLKADLETLHTELAPATPIM